MPDRLEERLRTLRVDVDRVGLSHSAQVRRRGEQRTRHQAVGAVAATVAVVASIAGLAGGLVGDRDSAAPPVQQPTVTTTQQAWQPLELAPQPLLETTEIAPIGPYTGWQRTSAPVEESVRPLRCISSPAELGASRTEAAMFYQDLDASFIEHVLLFDDPAAAEAAARSVRTQFSTCGAGDPAEVTVSDRPAEPVDGVGDVAYRLSRLTTPKVDAGIGYYEAGVVTDDNMVVVLEWISMGNPFGDGHDDWVWTPERLQAALDQAVAD